MTRIRIRMTMLGPPMYVFKCSGTRTSFIKQKHIQLLAFTSSVSPSESELEGLTFSCAVTIT